MHGRGRRWLAGNAPPNTACQYCTVDRGVAVSGMPTLDRKEGWTGATYVRIARVHRLRRPTPPSGDRDPAPERYAVARDTRGPRQPCVVHAHGRRPRGGLREELLELRVGEETVRGQCRARVHDDPVRVALARALVFVFVTGGRAAPGRGGSGGVDRGVHDAGRGELLLLGGEERVADEEGVRGVVWGEVEVWSVPAGGRSQGRSRDEGEGAGVRRR